MSGIWQKIFESLASSEPQEKYVTDFPIQIFVQTLTVWVSYFLGGMLAFEQYFGKRIYCYTPINFTQPADIVSEHCWENGSFKHVEREEPISPTLHTGAQWLLHAWVYFILKALVMQLPYMVWKAKYQPLLKAVTKSTEDLLKQLSQHWLKFSESVSQKYVNSQPNTPESMAVEKNAAFQEAVTMTYNVIQITKRQVPDCSGMFSFTQLRWTYQVFILSIFTIIECILLLSCSSYKPSDFICILPNKEGIRCIVPHITVLWYALFLAFVCVILSLILLSTYLMWLVYFVHSNSANGSFLQQLPFAKNIIKSNSFWQKEKDRQIYRLLCVIVMQNSCILQPLNFLCAFVKQLDEDQKVLPNSRLDHKAINNNHQHVTVNQSYAPDDINRPLLVSSPQMPSQHSNTSGLTVNALRNSMRRSRPKSSSMDAIWQKRDDEV